MWEPESTRQFKIRSRRMSTRELTFSKIDGTWYYVIGNDQPSTQYEMSASTIPILELASKGNNQVALKLLRKNTLEKVKLSLGRVRYLKGGALYYVLDYTGALYGAKEVGRKKIWIGSATRKVLNNFPEVINLTW